MRQFRRNVWRELSARLAQQSGGAAGDDRKRVLDNLRNHHLLELPVPVVEIPAHRQLLGGGGNTWDFAGTGFIKDLRALAHSMRWLRGR